MKRTLLRSALAASSAGFSLIELAIGMAIVGMVLGGALLIGGKLWEVERREMAREHLDETKAALLDFARKNRRLPMMFTSTSWENYNDTGVDAGIESYAVFDVATYPIKPFPIGWVPYKTIDTKARDAFNRPVQYFVNWQLAKKEGGRPCQALKNLLRGKITPTDPYIANYKSQLNWDTPPASPKTRWYPLVQVKTRFPVAAVLVSSGADRNFNYPHLNAYKVQSQFFEVKEQTDTPDYFDDVVVYITLAEAYAALNCE